MKRSSAVQAARIISNRANLWRLDGLWITPLGVELKLNLKDIGVADGS